MLLGSGVDDVEAARVEERATGPVPAPHGAEASLSRCSRLAFADANGDSTGNVFDSVLAAEEE